MLKHLSGKIDDEMKTDLKTFIEAERRKTIDPTDSTSDETDEIAATKAESLMNVVMDQIKWRFGIDTDLPDFIKNILPYENKDGTKFLKYYVWYTLWQGWEQGSKIFPDYVLFNENLKF